MANFCGQCGSDTPGTGRFCRQCGSALEIVSPDAVTRSSAPTVVPIHSDAVNGSGLQKFLWPTIIVVGALLLGWIYFSPYVAIRNLRQAARDGNIDALKDAVDFPALRESLKNEMGEQVSKKAIADMKEDDDAFSALGAAAAKGLMNVFIDQLITPELLVSVVNGKVDQDSSSGVSNFLGAYRLTGKEGDVTLTSGYESFNRFDIRIFPPQSKLPITFLLQRSGLISWRLNAVRIPDLNELGKGSSSSSISHTEALNGEYTFKTDNTMGEMAVREDPDGVYLKIGTTRTEPNMRMCEFETNCGFSAIPITHSPLKPITHSPAIPISVLP